MIVIERQKEAVGVALRRDCFEDVPGIAAQLIPDPGPNRDRDHDRKTGERHEDAKAQSDQLGVGPCTCMARE